MILSVKYGRSKSPLPFPHEFVNFIWIAQCYLNSYTNMLLAKNIKNHTRILSILVKLHLLFFIGVWEGVVLESNTFAKEYEKIEETYGRTVQLE